MSFTRTQRTVLIFAGAWVLTGCSGLNPFSSPSPSTPSAATERFVYQGHDFGADRDAPYRQGVMDGCKTAGGTYAKNHALFRTNTSYQAGWENGRLRCGK